MILQPLLAGMKLIEGLPHQNDWLQVRAKKRDLIKDIHNRVAVQNKRYMYTVVTGKRKTLVAVDLRYNVRQ